MTAEERSKRLKSLREQIDMLDAALVTLIAKRMTLMKETGLEKKHLQLPIRDKKREEEKLHMLRNQSTAFSIPPHVIESIWELFFHMAADIEK